jgi:hypothetical protein
VYFFNPNSDRGQRWGPELVTSTQGHGEYAGESSLPFAQFSSRVYVFHYDEREHGDPLQVPDVEILPIVEMVRLSWGALRGWI